MRDPRGYTRSVLISQGFITAIYIAIGIVVYYFCGSYVASPALGSAGVTMKKVCYGLALPGLLVSTILLSHVSLACSRWRTASLTFTIATSEVSLLANPSWIQASHVKFQDTLDGVAGLYPQRHRLRLRYCECNSYL